MFLLIFLSRAENFFSPGVCSFVRSLKTPQVFLFALFTKTNGFRLFSHWLQFYTVFLEMLD